MIGNISLTLDDPTKVVPPLSYWHTMPIWEKVLIFIFVAFAWSLFCWIATHRLDKGVNNEEEN